MKKFGIVKSKTLSKLAESYANGDKKMIKKIINTIKEDKNFKELYLLYEDMESKYFEDKQIAESYIIELGRSLNGKIKQVSTTIKKLEEAIGDIETKYSSLYDDLDYLLQEDNLLNIETKVLAKIELLKHLTTKKQISESKVDSFTTNERVLLSVMTNNFNLLYNNSLSEEDRKEFKNILSLNENEITNETNKLKDDLLTKIESLLNESLDSDFREKLLIVKKEVQTSQASKFNYYKLKELKAGL
jgi:regulator of replication initiation timing